jgi:phosphatidylserine/phosphatidylglycerophosphate/cardiolipin synthase-like enzyme
MGMMEILHRLDSRVLRELAISLRQGSLASCISSHAIQQVVGTNLTPDVLDYLRALETDGWLHSQIATLADNIAFERESAIYPEQILDIVLSGPDVPGVPTRDTAVIMQTLFEEAKREVILVTYAIRDGQILFRRLAERMVENPKLDVWFCLNIARSPHDRSSTSEIIQHFAREFIKKHWPWEIRPKIFYDPRSLEVNSTIRASLHAKCLIVDSRVALITSANYTEAAQKRNIEVGMIVRYSPCVERLAGYFRKLIETKVLHSYTL